MVELTHSWDLDVQRGPDWLFVRPHGLPRNAEDVAHFAQQVWALLEQTLVHRLVLELDHISVLDSLLVGQLVWLHKRIHTHGGLMRICGLSSANYNVLCTSRLDGRFPRYANREDAVMGFPPTQPR